MITKKRSTNPILRWIQNEDNMNMLYGLGAAIVILGALFKLQGWPFANAMLIAGLGAEAIIFAISAFDPPTSHEWDWSKVYPQLMPEGKGSNASQFKDMMKEAQLDSAVLKSVGDGMKKMATQAGNINELAGASVAAKEYSDCLLYTSPSPRDLSTSRMPSSA